ncbi:MAG: penicillin-binding protein 2 [Gammaproteobacteria bacterium]|nr:penicillin-binding protein 2 [Gammaproteobacteria bacterium]
MDLLSPIKDHHSERRVFLGRVILTSVIGIVLLGLVIARLVQLQVFDYEHFAERSLGNRVRIEAVPPIRGLVFDRQGRILAENLPAYQLELIPEQVPDVEATLRRLSALELIDASDIPRLKALSQSGPRFKPVALNPRLDDEQIARFAIQRPRFPGVDFRPRLVRHYPSGEYIAHAVGYVGALSTADLERLDPSRYAGTTQTGKTGIENSYESRLHGDSGFRHIVTNARGRQVPAESRDLQDTLPADEQPSPGDNLYLSIDLDLQAIATEQLAGRRGAVVALDPWSGEVLALVSAPSFDPNLFAVGMSQSQFAGLQQNLDRPLFNRAVRGTYPPGSTIKPMLALAALETGATNLERRTVCYGFFMLPNTTHRYRDWKPEGHGDVDIHDAIAQSCDVYFYEISNDIGIDRMHDYLTRFGLGNETGVDVAGERPGLVPSTEWKRNAFRNPSDKRWFQGETVIASIGQGFMLATPLQLATATAALATRGIRYEPRIVAAWEDPLTGERTLASPVRLDDIELDNDTNWDTVIGAMNSVMQGPRGTARAVGSGAPYLMAGKSGTAQVFSVAQDEEYDEEEVEERLKDHALFVAFAPVENPQIAVAVIVENGSSGSGVAAPIARAIMDSYLGYDDAAD